MWKKRRGSQQAPILHGISREHYAVHAAQLFIDRSSVPHVHVEYAPAMGHIRQKKYPFLIGCKKFSERRCFHDFAWYCVYDVALLYDVLSLFGLN